MQKTKLGASAALIALALGGCSDNGTRADPSPSPPTTSAPPAPRFSADRNLCQELSPDVVRQLLTRDDPPELVPSLGLCTWSVGTVGDPHRRSLSVRYEAEDHRSDVAAAARRQYETQVRQMTRDPATASAVAVTGLGDDAQVIRQMDEGFGRYVALVVRKDNAVLQVMLRGSLATVGVRQPGAAMADQEAGVFLAMRDLLTKLGTPPPPEPVPQHAPDDVLLVDDACTLSRPNAERTRPGTEGKEPFPRTDKRSTCIWGDDPGTRLSVDIEATAPNPLTGESAAQVAEALVLAWSPGGARSGPPQPLSGLGQQARVVAHEIETQICAQRGNLMVTVQLANWPPVDESTLREQAAAVVAGILARHP